MPSETFKASFNSYDMGAVMKDSLTFTITEEGFAKKAPRIKGSRHRAMGGETLQISFTTRLKSASMTAWVQLIKAVVGNLGSDTATLTFTINGSDEDFDDTLFKSVTYRQLGTDGYHYAAWSFETTPIAQAVIT